LGQQIGTAAKKALKVVPRSCNNDRSRGIAVTVTSSKSSVMMTTMLAG